MKKVVSTILEWSYAPPNYLEEEISISYCGVNLSLSNGIARAIINPVEYNSISTLKDSLTRIVDGRLRAVQILTHTNYSLTGPSRTDLHEDGTRSVYLEVGIATSVEINGNLDLVVTDKEGKVIRDTKRESIEHENWFAASVSRFRTLDNTLDQVLASYQLAVKDPSNEFLYLYEIRDAIASKFGSKKNSLKQLGIIEKDWNLLGELANKRNIKQGRHRGEFAGALRDAYETELDAARKIAVGLIEKYLLYLENKSEK